MSLRTIAAGVTLALTFGLGAARADTLFTLAAPTAELETPGFLEVMFDANAGVGDVTFRLDGYASLDAINPPYTDIFSLILNGSTIFQGSFDMGGGGTNTVLLAPMGATASPHSNGFFAGGFTDIFVPLTLAAGSNTLRFDYTGGAQGLGDEGWGLHTAVVTGSALTAVVPEPASWAMMLTGFAGLGVVLRRRRGLAAASA